MGKKTNSEADSEEFKAVLEYVNQFPDSVESGREEEPLSDKIQKGEVLFAIAELYPPFIFQDYVKMFGEDAAWNFIEDSLTREKEDELHAGFYITYPVLKKTLNENM